MNEVENATDRHIDKQTDRQTDKHTRIETDLTRSVQQVGEGDEGVSDVHIEQKESGEKRHSLNVAHIRPISRVRAKQTMQHVVVRTTFLKYAQVRECSGSDRSINK